MVFSNCEVSTMGLLFGPAVVFRLALAVSATNVLVKASLVRQDKLL